MAEKDITEKILLSYADVFADVVNGLLVKGEQIIRPEDLADQTPRAIYKADGKVREIERDVAKRWLKNNIRIACIGFENETDPDRDMPLRVFAYDGAEYRTQLLKENKENPRYPVFTLVLYFGYKKHWNKPTWLHESVKIPEIFKPYVTDLKINLFEIAYLTDEQLSYFHSDFKVVADYFVQMQRNGKYTGSKDELKHVEAVFQLLSVMSGDSRFEEILNRTEESGKGGIKNMCDWIDMVLAEGETKGIIQGKIQGKIQGAIETYRDEMNLMPTEIINKIMVRYSLDKETAEKYVEETLGLEFV